VDPIPGEAQAPPKISKRAKILEMIRRSGVATLSEIAATTGWQAHSIRSFVSTLAKRDHIRIRSAKNQAGERVYQIRA
jgi:predicted ArsR family transcriptional regulator